MQKCFDNCLIRRELAWRLGFLDSVRVPGVRVYLIGVDLGVRFCEDSGGSLSEFVQSFVSFVFLLQITTFCRTVWIHWATLQHIWALISRVPAYASFHVLCSSSIDLLSRNSLTIYCRHEPNTAAI